MNIRGIHKTSFIDYPGKISAVLFTGGCNLECGYCHNPALARNDQNLEVISGKDALEFLSRRKGLIDAVTLSGGEPTLQKDIQDFIESVKKRDMSWASKIRTIIDSTSQSDEYEYSHHRFNRRYFAQGVYSPGRSLRYRNVVTVAVDVSGSMVMKPQDIEAAFGIIEDLLPGFRVCLLCVDETVFVPEKSGKSFTRSAIVGASASAAAKDV